MFTINPFVDLTVFLSPLAMQVYIILMVLAVAAGTLFDRQETRWPGYYYRGDYPKLDDTEWHVFTASQYDPETGEWHMSKLPVHYLID